MSRSLDATDLSIIDQAETYLARGLEIYRWFRSAQRSRSFAHRFKLFDQLHRRDTNYGFLDDITVAGESFPVLGTAQTTNYAQPKMPPTASAEAKQNSVEWMRGQVREYMLRYFMRVSSYRAPQFTPARPDREAPAFLRRLPYLVNLGAAGPVGRRGWGYRQLYYKRTDGEVGKFDKSAQRKIVDVREIGAKYEWVILEVHVFDFDLSGAPPSSPTGSCRSAFPSGPSSRSSSAVTSWSTRPIPSRAWSAATAGAMPSSARRGTLTSCWATGPTISGRLS